MTLQEETPPRAWGRLSNDTGLSFLGRNTPTCVGKTPGSAGMTYVWWKHPHVRGEDPSVCFW